MVDINTSRSALQAQLQASQQGKVGEPTPYNSSQDARDTFRRSVDNRPDQSVGAGKAAKPKSTVATFSSAEELEGASRRAAEFAGPQREAPTGRQSQLALGTVRDQPLGQIVNILV